MKKLLRFNQSPVEFQDSDLSSIEKEGNLIRINFQNGNSYLGYHIKDK